MPDPTRVTRPGGTWPSPVTSDLVARQATRLSHPRVSASALYWIERRPEEGRDVLVRHGPSGPPTEVLAPGASARSLVHEYGSRPYVVGPHDVVYVSVLDDQRLYCVAPGCAPHAITPPPPSPRAFRYADPVLTAEADGVICVRERHGATRVDNDLVLVATDGAEPRTLHEGHDFYATPVVSPDGKRLAWIAWDHPAMPWDATLLYEATLSDAGLGRVRLVAGGPHEAVQQPRYAADGSLLFLSDRTGWWNLYRDDARGASSLAARDDEFADPPWSSQPSYVPQHDGTIAVTWSRGPWYHLGVLTPDGALDEIDTPWSTIVSLDGNGDGTIVAVVASPTGAPSVARLRLADGHAQVVRAGGRDEVDAAYLPTPALLDVATRDGEVTHALYYPPTHPTYALDGPAPLLVTGHVGPTSHCLATLDYEIAFWTSRGIGVLGVDYRGSSGYGRPYRERLRSQWGILDVADCVDAARDLVRRGLADGAALLIRGKSAGGFTALCAATFHDDFAGATSYYGITELSTLARDAHKFEAHYHEGLVGAWPAQRELYDARSPAQHADQVTTPLLLIQGAEDPVVPLSQATTMADVLRERHVPVTLLLLEGEGHGLRQAASIRRALEAELSFYGRVLGFTAADDGAGESGEATGVNRYAAPMDYDVVKSDEQWRAELPGDRYAVLRGAATEPPFTGSLLHVDHRGVFSCAGCGQELFTTDQKFDSGCGWPSFDACEPGTIVERPDHSLLRSRTEILCARCGGHLGHVFDDGPTPTGLRYCVNSLALEFAPVED